MNAILASSVSSQFKKSEIRSIAEELDLTFDLGERSSVMVEKIMADIDEKGVPEADGCSDLLFSFLVTAEYMDNEGKILGIVETVEPKDVPEEEIPKPRCFSLADARDPSCSRCRVLSLCLKERERRRPGCFGKSHDAHAPECQSCIEAPQCAVLTNSNQGK